MSTEWLYLPIEERDRDLLFAWANTPELVKYLPSMPKPLLWQSHCFWFAKVYEGKDRVDRMLAVPLNGGGIQRIGRVHASWDDYEMPEVGVFIGVQEWWGYGFATRAISWLDAWLASKGYSIWKALIHSDNIGSIKAYTKNGYVCDGFQGRNGQLIYIKAI